MDTLEIMEYEAVENVSEKLSHVGVGKGFKIAVGVSLTVLTGIVAYKFVIKPTIDRMRNDEPLIQLVNEDTSESETVIVESESAAQ